MRILIILVQLFWASLAFAQNSQDAVTTVGGFSEDIMKLLQGPIIKVVGAVVLLCGVGALLRGRQQIAIACGIGFIILLFLPSLITKVGINQ